MKKLFLFFILALFFGEAAFGQQNDKDSVMVVFWNLENFFDPFVDSTRVYNEFTETGDQHWTASRFYRKRNNLYKAILSFSDGCPIGIFGVCEVENEYVLNALFSQTPLKRFNYRWVHYDGPDKRGIDPAIVYSKDLFQLMASEVIPYFDPDNVNVVSRDILYAKFFDYQQDTIHCFVNHWPSKYSGELETLEARNVAARMLRRKVDSILEIQPEARIIIMGDFNDTPDSPCIHDVLGAVGPSEILEGDVLVNLFSDVSNLGFKGTLKYREAWMIFDQIIISKSLVYNDMLFCNSSDALIIHDPILLEEDRTYHGQKLNRTYVGPKYHGGFSDHLPVRILLRYSHR